MVPPPLSPIRIHGDLNEENRKSKNNKMKEKFD